LIYACGGAQPSERFQEMAAKSGLRRWFPKIRLDLLEKFHLSSKVSRAGPGDGADRLRQYAA
jgi:hypothetical protein